MQKRLVRVIGTALLLTGIAGFVPGLSKVDAGGEQLLFGIFMVGAFHNAFHVLSGVAGLLVGRDERAARWYLRIFGLVYGILAVIGLTVGIGRVNTADHILHGILAVVMLGAGLGAATDANSLSPFKRKGAAQ